MSTPQTDSLEEIWRLLDTSLRQLEGASRARRQLVAELRNPATPPDVRLEIIRHIHDQAQAHIGAALPQCPPELRNRLETALREPRDRRRRR